MVEDSLAGILLNSAGQDALVFRKLSGDVEVGDAILGFHAQQAVEKALKAALAQAGVLYRRTHDIAELLDVLADSGLSIAPPPHAEMLDELNPYAVEMRYGLVQPGKLDRETTQRILDAVLKWANGVLTQA